MIFSIISPADVRGSEAVRRHESALAQCVSAARHERHGSHLLATKRVVVPERGSQQQPTQEDVVHLQPHVRRRQLPARHRQNRR